MSFHSEKLHLTPGYLYFIPAGIPLDYHCPKNAVQWYLHFREEHPGTLPLHVLYPFVHQVRLPDSRMVEGHLEYLIQEYGEHPELTPSWIFETNGILLQLVSFFVKNRTDPKIARFLPVLDYVSANLSEDLSVQTLADRLGLERTHFTREFRKAFNETPARYVRKRRVESAMYVLQSTRMGLDQIASDLGFYDAFHFSKSFKGEFGISPKEYRDREIHVP